MNINTTRAAAFISEIPPTSLKYSTEWSHNSRQQSPCWRTPRPPWGGPTVGDVQYTPTPRVHHIVPPDHGSLARAVLSLSSDLSCKQLKPELSHK